MAVKVHGVGRAHNTNHKVQVQVPLEIKTSEDCVQSVDC
jgi:hypothetical protein